MRRRSSVARSRRVATRLSAGKVCGFSCRLRPSFRILNPAVLAPAPSAPKPVSVPHPSAAGLRGVRRGVFLFGFVKGAIMTTFQCSTAAPGRDGGASHRSEGAERLIIDNCGKLLQPTSTRPQKMVINFAGVTHCSSVLGL